MHQSTISHLRQSASLELSASEAAKLQALSEHAETLNALSTQKEEFVVHTVMVWRLGVLRTRFREWDRYVKKRKKQKEAVVEKIVRVIYNKRIVRAWLEWKKQTELFVLKNRCQQAIKQVFLFFFSLFFIFFLSFFVFIFIFSEWFDLFGLFDL